jgi:uncharacterized membrane protein YphA (DoxX/SURF4 family)
MNSSLGRYVYALAAIGLGICAFAFGDVTSLHQVKALSESPYRAVLTDVVATVEILAGLALLWPRAAQAGALAFGAIYFVFALLGIPYIIKHPLIYNGYGNFLEHFSFVSGALILYARRTQFARIGYYTFGVCVISFALEQLFYLPATASLVPKWIPPSQMFWAVVTTAAFGLAAAGLLTGFLARLAACLTAAMVLGFGLLVWLPALFADSHSHENWSESLITLGVAASAWVVADFLDGASRRASD